MYPIEKYKVYTYSDKETSAKIIAAVSTYAGKTVKAYAKCDPRASYDEAAGKKLAAARCNAKIAVKRRARAARKVAEAQAQFNAAKAHLDKMNKYLADASTEAKVAQSDLADLEKTM